LEEDTAAPDHGSGRPGVASFAGRVTTVSVVRGAWEVRLVRAERPADAAVALRVGGWAAGPGHVATPVPLLGGGAPARGEAAHDDAAPLAGPTRTPWLRYAPVPDGWVGVGVHLGRAPAPADLPHPRLDLTAGRVVVTWPDGRQTTATLP